MDIDAPLPSMQENLVQILQQYKSDKESVYNTWIINNDERLKAFRTIRRGVLQVIDDIRNKTFPNDFKESSLELVLSCIAEQKQVFVVWHILFIGNLNCVYQIFTKIKIIK